MPAKKPVSKKPVAKDIEGDLLDKHNIIGILLLLAVVSIGYSTLTIILGTDGIVPVVMVLPQTVLGAIILIWKFCK